MAPKCNIGRRGAHLRLVMGIVSCLVAVGLVVAVATGNVDDESVMLAWVGIGVLLTLGGLCIYEGLNSWCIVKAFAAKFFAK